MAHDVLVVNRQEFHITKINLIKIGVIQRPLSNVLSTTFSSNARLTPLNRDGTLR